MTTAGDIVSGATENRRRSATELRSATAPGSAIKLNRATQFESATTLTSAMHGRLATPLNSTPRQSWTRRLSSASRLLGVVLLLAMLAACTPFQPGMPGEGSAADPGIEVLRAAEAQIGAPYRWGGAGPDAFDCSGLVAYAHRYIGLSVPRTAAEQFASAVPVSRRDLRPGDLVFFRLDGGAVSHVGIYAGGERFVHAPKAGGRVGSASLDDDWYRQRFVGAGRFYSLPH
jgi:cell wall-associated NlpC family hydrolase